MLRVHNLPVCMFILSASDSLIDVLLLHLAGGLVRLGAEVRGGGAGVLEEAGEEGLDEGAEDDLGATAEDISKR